MRRLFLGYHCGVMSSKIAYFIQQYFPYLVVPLIAYLWDRFIVPILVRPFGVFIPTDLFLLRYRKRKSDLLLLNYKQYVLISGAVMFGGTMTIVMLGCDYVALRHFGERPFPPLTLGWCFMTIAIWTVVGAAMASDEWNKKSPNSTRNTDQTSPLGYRSN